MLSPLFSDYTYLDYDKLIFGNGGGFQLISTDNENYFLQVLDIGSSEYISKGFNIDGKFKSITPSTLNAYLETDLLDFDNLAAFDPDDFPVIPSYDAAANLPLNKVFFVGELLGKSMLLNHNSIEGIIKNTAEYSFSNEGIYIQEENGPVFMGSLSAFDEPVLTIFPNIEGSSYLGINTMEPAEAITVSGDLQINGNIALTQPIGIFETGVEFPGTNFDTNTVAINQLLAEYEFTCPPYVTHNITVISMLSGKTNQSIGAYLWAYCILKYKDENGEWQVYTDPNPDTSWVEAGLRGIKYGGYFNDNFIGDLNFFKTALIESDPRFDTLFTSINETTPGTNFDDTYSVRFYGYFTASTTETYTFYTTSDDSSWLWIGNANESIVELEGRRNAENAIVVNSGVHGLVVKSGTIDLVSGETYPILIYFGENYGADIIKVEFETATIPKTSDGTNYYSTISGTISDRSFSAFDGHIGITGFHLAPQFTALITPNDDGTPKEYKVELYAYNSDAYFTVETTKINILGLPSSSYAGAFTGYDISNATPTLNNTVFAELDGNYLTDQVLSFGSGGGIIESGDSLVFTDGTNYLDFRASNLSFGSFHYIDSLKVFSDDDTNNYPYKIGSTGSYLGIDSYGSFYGGLVTANIQTLNNSQNPVDTPLNLISDIYIGDTISIREGTPVINMEVGEVIEDSDYALNVSGNILFTGEFKGTYGIITSNYIDGTRGTEALMSNTSTNGYTFDDNPDDYISITLPDFSNWDVMMFSQMSVTIRHNQDDLMWIILKNVDTNTSYISEPTIIHSSQSISWRHSFYNTFTQENVPPGNYHIYLRMLSRYSNGGGPAARTIDIDGNGSSGGSDFTLSYYRLSGTLGLIALPSD